MQQTILQPDKEAPPNRRLIQALCFVLFFSVVNATMFNVALPDIAAYFNLPPSSVSWIVTGYSVIYALGSLIYGKLADKYPLKRLITIGLLLFAAGSAIGYFSSTYPLVLAARLIQSAGASCVPALVMLIPVRFFPAEQRGRVMGVIASTMAFSAGIGPILGGFITGSFQWNGLFLISLCSLVALPFIRRSLPHEEVRSGEKVDLLGAGALGGGVAAFMLAVTRFSALWLLVSIVMIALFVWLLRRAEFPFLRISLFRISVYRNGLIVGFIATFAMFGIFLITPMMLQSVHHLNAQAIGFVMFPAAMLAAFMGRIGGRLTDQRGSLFTLYLAFGLLSFGLLSLSSFAGLVGWVAGFFLIFSNVAYTFVQSSLAKVISSALPRDQTGVGLGVYNMINFLSGAISGAILTKTVEFDWSAMNITAIAKPSTFGVIYFVLALIILGNITLVYRKLKSASVVPAAEFPNA